MLNAVETIDLMVYDEARGTIGHLLTDYEITFSTMMTQERLKSIYEELCTRDGKKYLKIEIYWGIFEGEGDFEFDNETMVFLRKYEYDPQAMERIAEEEDEEEEETKNWKK